MEKWLEKYEMLKASDIPCLSLTQQDAFIETISNKAHQKSAYEKLKAKSLVYLEKGFSARYLFETCCSKNKSMKDAVPSIPSLYESTMIMTLISQDFHPIIVDTYKRVVQENQRKSTGFFNFLLWHGDNLASDELDTTSVTVNALLELGCINFTDGQKLGKLMLQKIQKNEQGVFGTYFCGNPENPEKTLLHLLGNRKAHVDVGVLLNFLWLLGFLKLDTDPELEPSLAVMDLALKELLEVPDDEHLPSNCKYYSNPFVLILLFSRMLGNVSSKIAERFERKLQLVIEKRIFKLQNESQNPVNLSCLILAALNCNLHLNPKISEEIIKFVKLLIAQQDKEDGSFPLCCFYGWKKVVYFGSKYLSTAISLKALEVVGKKLGEEPLNQIFDEVC